MHGSQLCVAVSDVYRITTEPNPQKAKGLHEKGNKTHTQACTCKKKKGGGGGGELSGPLHLTQAVGQGTAHTPLCFARRDAVKLCAASE